MSLYEKSTVRKGVPSVRYALLRDVESIHVTEITHSYFSKTLSDVHASSFCNVMMTGPSLVMAIECSYWAQ